MRSVGRPWGANRPLRDMLRRYAGIVGAVGIVLVLASPATAHGAKAHHYRAEVELDVSESYTLRDGALPSATHPCASATGWGARQVRWQASIGSVKYLRAGKGEALRSSSGRTRFAPFAAVMEAEVRDGVGPFSPPECAGLPGASPGALVAQSCLRKLTGRPLEVRLAGSVKKKRLRIRNRGPRLPKNRRRQCGPSFRDHRAFDREDLRFDDSRAIFDGFRLRASGNDIRRLRRGLSVRMTGRVRLKNAVQDCCAGIGAASVGAVWNVTARAAIRLVPRASGAGGGGGGGGGGDGGRGGGGKQGGRGDSRGGGGCDIAGTNRSDLLIGTNGDDQICGFGGNDVLIGRAGNDSIRGGSGADRIEGGLGDDLIHGEGGADDVNAGDGDDIVSGDEGSDTIAGGSGVDKLFGDGADDILRGGTGNDDLFGGAGNDSLYGEAGDDGLSGMAGWDLLDGGAGLNGCVDDGAIKNTYINCGKGDD